MYLVVTIKVSLAHGTIWNQIDDHLELRRPIKENKGMKKLQSKSKWRERSILNLIMRTVLTDGLASFWPWKYSGPKLEGFNHRRHATLKHSNDCTDDYRTTSSRKLYCCLNHKCYFHRSVILWFLERATFIYQTTVPFGKLYLLVSVAMYVMNHFW